METPVRDPEVPSSTDVAELHLLISEMDDELSRYRWREAVWISIVFHVLVFLAVIFAPKLIPKSALIVPITQSSKDATFLMAPPDQQRVKPPKTDITSDKNRIAQSRTPVPNKDLLRKLLDANRPGPPAPKAPPPAPSQQAAQQNPAQQANPQQQPGAQNAPQPPQPQQTAQLNTPPVGGGPSPFKTAPLGVQHAIDSVAASHAAPTHYTFSARGDYGSGRAQPNSELHGDVDILNDTMGVDFGPYLQRILYVIRKNWINLIPEGAFAKKGKLAIQFAIMKQGNIQGMQPVFSSGDLVLDRAAWGGITNSDPLDQLPPDFKGNFLQLRITFYYNMDISSSGIR